MVVVVLLLQSKSAIAQPTIEQVNQALDIADQAASHGLIDLSMRAVIRALSDGPPTVSTSPLKSVVQHVGARIDTSQPLPPTAKEAADARILRTIFRLSEEWGRTASPTQVYETLREIVLPTGRPSEAFLYNFPMKIDPLQPNRLPPVKNAAVLLIDWARKADKTADLQTTLGERHFANSTAGILVGLLTSLELQNAKQIEQYNAAITRQLAKGEDRPFAEMTASVGVSYYLDGRYPTVAANLLELAGQTIQRIDAVQRRQDSPGPAIVLAAARSWFSTGETKRGVGMLKLYLENTPLVNDAPDVLSRRTDVVGNELFSRGLVAEARELLGDQVAGVFERRYQMSSSSETRPTPSTDVAVTNSDRARIIPASAIDSISKAADHIWVCLLDPATESSTVLFTIPDFQHAGSPAVSPDGATVAFDASFPGEAVTSDARIYVAQLDGSRMDCLGRGCSPSWSPAGKRIAYSAYLPTRGVWIMRSSGEDARLVDRFGWSGQWSPNGRMLAYTKLTGGDWDFMVYDIVENEFFSAFGGENCPFEQIFPDFTWSPDSSSLLFKASRNRDPNNTAFELATLPVLSEGISQFARVNYGLGDDVTWNAKGIVTLSAKESKNQPEQLLTLNATISGTPQALRGQFEDRRNIGASWMPDGRRLVYISKPARK